MQLVSTKAVIAMLWVSTVGIVFIAMNLIDRLVRRSAGTRLHVLLWDSRRRPRNPDREAVHSMDLCAEMSGRPFGVADVARTPLIARLMLFLVAFHIAPIGNLWAQVPGTPRHDHLTEVACVDVPPDEKRPEFGCFNVGMVTGFHFSQASVYWHLRTFPSRKAAEAREECHGNRVEEDRRVWISEFGDRNSAPREGKFIALVGPLHLPSAISYAAVLSYAVMRPGDSSRVHTHPGPEGWYVLEREQCLETPAGANRARAGRTASVPSNVPMELNVTGKTLRRAFALVIHDSLRRGVYPLTGNPPESAVSKPVPEPSSSVTGGVDAGENPIPHAREEHAAANDSVKK